MRVDVHADLKPLQRAFIGLRAKQAPFATALALTSLAKGVQTLEGEEIIETFKSPTPFTQKAFGITSATKSRPVATVFAKDVQAEYLAPYVDGGARSLGSKKAMLVPVDVGTNQYGNLPRNKLAQLKGKPGVFIGTVQTKAGKRIAGVWQRPRPVAAGKRRKGMTQSRQHLKLLIEFKDTTPAPSHLPFFEKANAYLRANAAREFDAAMRKALATAKR